MRSLALIGAVAALLMIPITDSMAARGGHGGHGGARAGGGGAVRMGGGPRVGAFRGGAARIYRGPRNGFIYRRGIYPRYGYYRYPFRRYGHYYGYRYPHYRRYYVWPYYGSCWRLRWSPYYGWVRTNVCGYPYVRYWPRYYGYRVFPYL